MMHESPYIRLSVGRSQEMPKENGNLSALKGPAMIIVGSTKIRGFEKRG